MQCIACMPILRVCICNQYIINLCVAIPLTDESINLPGIITRNGTESEFRQTGDDSKPPSSPMHFNIIGKSRDPS